MAISAAVSRTVKPWKKRKISKLRFLADSLRRPAKSQMAPTSSITRQMALLHPLQAIFDRIEIENRERDLAKPQMPVQERPVKVADDGVQESVHVSELIQIEFDSHELDEGLLDQVVRLARTVSEVARQFLNLFITPEECLGVPVKRLPFVRELEHPYT